MPVYSSAARVRRRKRRTVMNQSQNNLRNDDPTGGYHPRHGLQFLINPRGRTTIILLVLALYCLTSFKNFGWQDTSNSLDVFSELNKSPEGKKSTSYTEFYIQSDHLFPIIFVTLLGYKRHPDEGTTNNDNAVAKFVYLGNGTSQTTITPSTTPLLLRMDAIRNNAKDTRDEWTIAYRLNPDFLVPPWASNLIFQISIRIEYSSFEDAMENFPTQHCSFQGKMTSIQNRRLPPFKIQQQKNQDDTSYSLLSAWSSPISWLRRHDPHMDWAIYSDDTLAKQSSKHYQCQSWKGKKPYRLVIIGDSQPSYMCHYLLASTKNKQQPNSAHPYSSCVTLKGTYADESHTSLQDFSIKYSEAILNATSLTAKGGGHQHKDNLVIVFNTQGLWESAYGKLELFRSMLDHVLKTSVAPSLLPHQPQNGAVPLFVFLTTTAVHPNNYNPGIYNDSRKWTMTQPRVHAINLMARERMKAFYQQQPQPMRKHVLLVDVEGISLLREDDPMMESDMRHYGNTTNELLLTQLLCSIDKHIQQNRFLLQYR